MFQKFHDIYLKPRNIKLILCIFFLIGYLIFAKVGIDWLITKRHQAFDRKLDTIHQEIDKRMVTIHHFFPDEEKITYLESDSYIVYDHGKRYEVVLSDNGKEIIYQKITK
ncbi:hypothetical protein [Listeria booriae]|uniref:Uncharacterized protein n=1 Tax=Listeria booriae TaxID=1552123 RepID=A0A842FMW4_9LIST|nr:hypothetical protein [Listeria booriae]MBC2292971.1 hypothetical protein [Listeria booriae]MBC2676261.1 hypothetical protein [Listeria booriae]